MPTLNISSFRGVPHPQLNAYIRELCVSHDRAGRGHSIFLPDIPSFTLHPDENRSDRDSAVGINDEPLPTDTVKVSDLQKSNLHARKYASLILEDVVGKTDKRTERGDPMSVKTYGWRLVGSEQLVNPHLVEDFSAATSLSLLAETVLVYVGMNDRTSKVLDKLLKGGVKTQEIEWSINPHEALIKSAWSCNRRSEDHAHDERVCHCKGKTKRVLVCAVKGYQLSIMPVRFDTYVWTPDTVKELEAYAEFARKVVE